VTVALRVTFWSATSTNPKLSVPEGTSRAHAAAGADTASSTRTSPPPMRVIGARAPVSGSLTTSVSPLFTSSDFTSSGRRPCPTDRPFGVPLAEAFWPPEASRTSAAAPETIGAAPDVPPNGPSPVPVPAIAETEAPGAPISGLMRVVSSCCGPRDELPTMLPASGIPTAGSKRTTVSGRPLFSLFASVWVIM